MNDSKYKLQFLLKIINNNKLDQKLVHILGNYYVRFIINTLTDEDLNEFIENISRIMYEIYENNVRLFNEIVISNTYIFYYVKKKFISKIIDKENNEYIIRILISLLGKNYKRNIIRRILKNIPCNCNQEILRDIVNTLTEVKDDYLKIINTLTRNNKLLRNKLCAIVFENYTPIHYFSVRLIDENSLLRKIKSKSESKRICSILISPKFNPMLRIKFIKKVTKNNTKFIPPNHYELNSTKIKEFVDKYKLDIKVICGFNISQIMLNFIELLNNTSKITEEEKINLLYLLIIKYMIIMGYRNLNLNKNFSPDRTTIYNVINNIKYKPVSVLDRFPKIIINNRLIYNVINDTIRVWIGCKIQYLYHVKSKFIKDIIIETLKEIPKIKTYNFILGK